MESTLEISIYPIMTCLLYVIDSQGLYKMPWYIIGAPLIYFFLTLIVGYALIKFFGKEEYEDII
jgi:hypothetical protein